MISKSITSKDLYSFTTTATTHKINNKAGFRYRECEDVDKLAVHPDIQE